MWKTKHLSTKAICTYSYHTCLYLCWLYLKLAVYCGTASNFIPKNIQNVGISKDIDQKNQTLTKKDSLSAMPKKSRLVSGNRPGEKFFITYPSAWVECVWECVFFVSKYTHKNKKISTSKFIRTNLCFFPSNNKR